MVTFVLDTPGSYIFLFFLVFTHNLTVLNSIVKSIFVVILGHGCLAFDTNHLLKASKTLILKKLKTLLLLHSQHIFFLEFGSTVGDDMGVGGDVCGDDVGAGGDGGGGGEDDCEEVFKPVNDILPSLSN
jgi:hypothetical protein